MSFLQFYCSLVLFGAWSGLLCAQTPRTQHGAVRVDKITDIVTIWKPDRHVYIKGNIGVSAGQLRNLDAWLEESAPNWVVVLADSSRGESYRATDGRSYLGLDAAEHALGQGLPNKTSFSELVHPVTGEANGAVFMLFLGDRKFSYYGSSAYSSRNLGSSRWQGYLDREAISAMRNGGRIVDAARGTVKLVDGLLMRQLREEKRKRAKSLADLRQKREAAAAGIRDAGTELVNLTERQEVFNREQNNPSGDLGRPPLSRWQALLQSASEAFANENVTSAEAVLNGVRVEMRAHRAALENYKKASSLLDAVEGELRDFAPGPGQAGSSLREEGLKLVKQAEEEHGKANSGYSRFYEGARMKLDAARAEVTVAEAKARAALKRRNSFLGTLALAILAGLAVLAVVLTIAWRRRKPSKAGAEALLASREEGFRARRDNYFQLLDRAGVVFGSASEIDRRGYTGRTRQVSQETIKDVDELFLRSSSLKSVIERARENVYPDSAFERFQNLFSRRNYERAADWLGKLPIRFREGDEIPVLVDEDSNKQLQLLDEKADYRGYALSYDQLLAECDERAVRAVSNLDLVENSWANISEDLETVRQRIDHLERLEQECSDLAAGDGLFTLSSVTAKLIPAAEMALADAEKTAVGDPVAALEEPVPLANRRARDGISVLESILAFREMDLNDLAAIRTKLDEHSHDTSWLGERLEELSLEADEAVTTAIDGDASSAIRQVTRRLTQLRERAVEILHLSEAWRNNASSTIDAASEHVVTVQATLGESTGLAKRAILSESGLNPVRRIEEARLQLDAAWANIGMGQVEAARQALGTADDLSREALQLADDSLGMWNDRKQRFARVKKERDGLRRQLKPHHLILRELQSQFTPAALLRGAAIKDYPGEQVSVTGHIEEVSRIIEGSLAEEKRAEQLIKKGKLLEGSYALDTTDEAHAFGGFLFEEIREQKASLEKTTEENRRRLPALAEALNSRAPQLSDHRATRETIAYAQQLGAGLTEAREVLMADLRNPFANSELLNGFDEQMEHVDQLLHRDRNLYEEAKSSINGAGIQLGKARDLVRQAATDQIPDSETIGRLTDETNRLEQDYTQAERVLKTAHKDWEALDIEADRITTEAARCTAGLRGELLKAEAAIAAMRTATDTVRRAAGWTGRLGVLIRSGAGHRDLEEARRAISFGHYDSCRHAALAAHQAAEAAIRAAEMEMARRIREKQRRQEIQRRRAMARHHSSSSSGFGGRSGGFGGSSGGFGGSSGGSSGFGRSSSSSGSGFGRSGW